MAIDLCSYDVVIVGSGPGGIAAACAAAASGRRVAVVDAGTTPGGQIWRGGLEKNGCPNARRWLKRFDASGCDYLANVQVVAAHSPNELVGVRGQEIVRLSYEKLILATGARDLFIPFPGWTTPGVMGAGGIQAAVKGGMEVKGKRIVVAGTGPLLLAVARSMKRAGATVSAIIEQADLKALFSMGKALIRHPRKLAQAARYKLSLLGTPYLTSSYPTGAVSQSGGLAVTIQCSSGTKEIHCDYLACGFHLTPNLELPRLLGCDIRAGAVVTDEYMKTSIDSVYAIGELLGIGGVDAALVEGWIAGLVATGQVDGVSSLLRKRQRIRSLAETMNTAFALRNEVKALVHNDTIVCRCEDVTHGQLKDKSSWREAKLYTRCGMGPCQGRVCSAATDALYGWTQETVRPPIFPVPATFWMHVDHSTDGQR